MCGCVGVLVVLLFHEGDMNSDRQQSMTTSDAVIIHSITNQCLPPESNLSRRFHIN